MPPKITPKTSLPDTANLGDIVALKSHSYFASDDDILISGDPLQISPLMVVVEKLKEGHSHYDENSGIQTIIEGNYQYRCTWYSQKSNHFEDAWFSARLLKKILQKTDENLNDETSDENNIKSFGSLVSLKTLGAELGKKKSTLSKKGNSSDEMNKSITSLLSFVPPIMQVIGTTKSDSKEPLIDPKTGKTKRYISKQLIKCKYFNQGSDKISETIMPIEALIFIATISEKKIKKIQGIIESKKYVRINEQDDGKLILSCYLLKKISHRHGYYYVEAFDYLENKTTEVKINNEIDQFIDLKNDIVKWPKFGEKKKALFIDTIEDNIREIMKKQNDNVLYRIQYKDINDKVTLRTIWDCSLIEFPTKDEKGIDINIKYLKAFCITRNAERHFRVDRIQKLWIFDLNV